MIVCLAWVMSVDAALDVDARVGGGRPVEISNVTCNELNIFKCIYY